MNALAVIPARGGSRRIPRKNIRNLGGIPVLHHVLREARRSGCFEEIMVSTDDKEIAGIAREGGGSVPFLRSSATAGDHATTADVLVEVLDAYAKEGRSFEFVCCLYPVAALLTAERLREGGAILNQDEGLRSVMSVLPYSHPTQRALRLAAGKVGAISPEFLSVRSQDLEPTYHDAGQWYWLRTAAFLQTREIIGSRTGAVVLSELEAQDVDTEDDWRMLELKFRLQHPD